MKQEMSPVDVSIPYKRVTNDLAGYLEDCPPRFQSPISGSQTLFESQEVPEYSEVSIPYKRVTNFDRCETGDPRGGGFNPL